MREQRGSVAVGTETEQDKVEGHAAQRLGVDGGGLGAGKAGRDRMNAWRHRQPLEQRLLDEPLIRASVVGWHAALVAEPHIDAAPVGLGGRGELVRTERRGAAGEHDGSAQDGKPGEQIGSSRGGSIGVREDDELESRESRRRAQPRAQPRNAASNSVLDSEESSSSSIRPTMAIVQRIWSR